MADNPSMMHMLAEIRAANENCETPNLFEIGVRRCGLGYSLAWYYLQRLIEFGMVETQKRGGHLQIRAMADGYDIPDIASGTALDANTGQ